MVVQMLTPEESAAHDLRVFSQIHPGTIFTYLNRSHRQEVALCKTRVNVDKIEVALINPSIFGGPAKTETLEFSQIEMVNIQREESIEISASQDWTYISLRDKANISNYKSFRSYESDDFLDDIKKAFETTETQITSMGGGKLFTITLWTEARKIIEFLNQRGWVELPNPPGFDWK